MRILRGNHHKLAAELMKEAIIEVERATCNESRRGIILARDKEILGRGYNGPTPGYWCDKMIDEAICGNRCSWFFPKAEERAVEDALKRGHSLADAVAYYAEYKLGSRGFAPDTAALQSMTYLSQHGISGFVFYAGARQQRLEFHTPYDLSQRIQARGLASGVT